MTADIHAAHAQVLIAIIAALIPLVIWAFRNAEDTLAQMRAQIIRRWERRE